jgi:hypothetical protein
MAGHGYIGRFGTPIQWIRGCLSAPQPRGYSDDELPRPPTVLPDPDPSFHLEIPLPPVPKSIRLLALALGILVALSALSVAVLAAALPMLSPGERPAWMLFGFEVVALVTGVLLALFGRGRFSDGPGLALGTFAGTLLVASAFGWISAGRQLAGVSLTPLLAVRVLVSFLLAAAGSYCILSRNPRSWRTFVNGALCGAPCAVVMGAALTSSGRRMLMSFISGGGIVQTALAILVLVVLGGLFCASVHLIIKAFEMGRVDEPRCGLPAAPPAVPTSKAVPQEAPKPAPAQV